MLDPVVKATSAVQARIAPAQQGMSVLSFLRVVRGAMIGCGVESGRG